MSFGTSVRRHLVEGSGNTSRGQEYEERSQLQLLGRAGLRPLAVNRRGSARKTDGEAHEERA